MGTYGTYMGPYGNQSNSTTWHRSIFGPKGSNSTIWHGSILSTGPYGSMRGPYGYKFGASSRHQNEQISDQKLGGKMVGDSGGGGIIFPGHPGPIPNVPKDQAFRPTIPSILTHGELLLPRIRVEGTCYGH